jgi:NADH kinase
VEREKWAVIEEEAMSRASGTHNRYIWLEPPRTALLVKKSNDQRATESATTIANFIKQQFSNLKLLIEPEAKKDLPFLEEYVQEEGAPPRYLGDVIDFVVAVGGDGTILHVSSLFEKSVPPVLSFSMGTLGFLMPFRIDDYKDAIRLVMRGGFFFTPRERLTCKVERKFQAINQPKTFQVMNEIALHRGAAVQISDIDVYINDAFLTNAKGDGLIVATATGSTAYSLSCGGSMVHPSIEAILLTPICPRSLSFRPALLPKDVIIKLKVSETSRAASTISFDGLQAMSLNRGEFAAVFTSSYYLPTVNRRDETSDWLRDINDLLSWNRKFG